MQVNIHELAAKEFDEAIEWYELQSKGLGERFKKFVIAQVNKIKMYPKWYLKKKIIFTKHTFQNFHIRYISQ